MTEYFCWFYLIQRLLVKVIQVIQLNYLEEHMQLGMATKRDGLLLQMRLLYVLICEEMMRQIQYSIQLE